MSRSFRLLFGVFFLLFLVAPSEKSRAQPSDSTLWRLEANSGYYTQEGTNDSGVGLFLNVGRRLSTGFMGSLGFGLAHTYSRYASRAPLFGDNRYYRTHYVFRLSFDYPFQITSRHHLLLGTGVVFVQRYWTRPNIRLRELEGGDLFVSGDTGTTTPNVVGLHFTAKYVYQISHVSLGIRADAHLFQFERGGEYVVAPLIAVHF